MKVWSFLSLSLLLLSNAVISRAESQQVISIQSALTVPDATLQPGKYQFAIEDQLSDRAILRISAVDSGSHYLVLAVPNKNLGTATSTGIVTFRNGSGDGSVLRGFECAECKTKFEVVYPKPQAAKILADSGQPVVAFDPTYDKLPSNLSQDDMKVVTLWLASPQKVTADNRGEGVDLAKLADARPATQTAAAATPERSSHPRSAGHVAARRALPKTAGSEFTYAAGGFILMLLGLAVRRSRYQAAVGTVNG
jgi:hypothetical protein